jgi:hypothetical protein
MALRSQISSIVANQLGGIQGNIEARIQTETVKLLDKFSNRCPDRDELIKIIKTRNSLLRVINSFQKKVNRFNSIPNKLRRPISIAKRIIKLLKRNRTKLAIGNRPSFSDFDRGGLFSAKTAGFTNRQADRLVKTTLLLEDLEDDLAAVKGLLQGVAPSFDNIKELLESINVNVEECAEELQQSQDQANLMDLIKEVQPLENTGSEGTPDENFTYRGANGKDYALSIIESPSDDTTVLRRVAIAKDIFGITVLRGQPSYSSDTKILLDELKFRIDNQLP